MFGRITALWLLGWSLVFTLVRKWTFQSRGLPAFRANYADDRIQLLSRQEQALLQSFSGCIACARCDVGERARIDASRGEYPGLMALVLSSLRSTRELQAAARGWRHVPLEVLSSKEPLCPTRVPFRAIKRFVEAKASTPGATATPNARDSAATNPSTPSETQ